VLDRERFAAILPKYANLRGHPLDGQTVSRTGSHRTFPEVLPMPLVESRGQKYPQSSGSKLTSGDNRVRIADAHRRPRRGMEPPGQLLRPLLMGNLSVRRGNELHVGSNRPRAKENRTRRRRRIPAIDASAY